MQSLMLCELLVKSSIATVTDLTWDCHFRREQVPKEFRNSIPAYTPAFSSCRVACMHTRVEGKRERERGTIALNSRFARSHFTNLHCNETGGRCRRRKWKIRRNGISVATWKFSTADGCQSFRDRFSSKSSRSDMCIYIIAWVVIYSN